MQSGLFMYLIYWIYLLHRFRFLHKWLFNWYITFFSCSHILVVCYLQNLVAIRLPFLTWLSL